MLDLGFVQNEKLNSNAMHLLDYANNLPIVKQLWQILVKVRDNSVYRAEIETARVDRSDIFTILAAILNF